MHSEETKEDIKLLARKINVPVHKIQEVVYLTFKFVRAIIKSANRDIEYYPAIRVFKLGIFYVTKNKQRRLKAKKDENNNNGEKE